MKKIALALALSGAALAAMAQSTPVGLWKTIDDETKAEKSLVRITSEGGVLSGKVEKVMDPTKQDAKCDKCEDSRKGQPIIGLQIIKGVKQDPDDTKLWEGGEILDPNNGKVYKVRLKSVDGGKKLDVRGYIGTPMLGRTQTWIRVE